MSLNQQIAEKYLRCPICSRPLALTDDKKSLKCTGGKHCFDIAAGGYVNLAVNHTVGGDSKESVRARSAFLRKDYYKPAAELICGAVSQYVAKGGFVIDAGCGEGYYSNLIASNGFDLCGFDLSKFACNTAAKTSDGSAVFAVASVYKLPIADNSADCVVNIFAPCVEAEYARVLKNGGVLIVAGAGEKHLMGLKKLLYENPYENTPRCDLPTELTHIDKIHSTFDIHVEGSDNISALFSMTPYYWRTPPAAAARLAEQTELDTVIDFEINIYGK